MVEQIVNFITRQLLKDPNRRIGRNEPLITSGLIDSFGLVDLALFVEEAFGVRIEDVELTASVFDTIDELAHLISRRLVNLTP
jgi:acyl carrier protein